MDVEVSKSWLCPIVPLYSAHVSSLPAPSMADTFKDEQQLLARLWKKARKDGCMPPWQQARVYGLNEAWAEMHGETSYGKAKWTSERVHVQGCRFQFSMFYNSYDAHDVVRPTELLQFSMLYSGYYAHCVSG